MSRKSNFRPLPATATQPAEVNEWLAPGSPDPAEAPTIEGEVITEATEPVQSEPVEVATVDAEQPVQDATEAAAEAEYELPGAVVITTDSQLAAIIASELAIAEIVDPVRPAPIVPAGWQMFEGGTEQPTPEAAPEQDAAEVEVVPEAEDCKLVVSGTYTESEARLIAALIVGKIHRNVVITREG